MKAKNLHRLLFAATLSGLLFAACKKSNSDSSSSTTTSSTDLQTQSDDEARVSTESSAAFDDANAAMIGESSVSGASYASAARFGVAVDGGNGSLGSLPGLLCNATVTVDSTSNPRTITITYNGKTADSLRSRTGSVVISIAQGVRWSEAGAVVTVSFNSLVITRLVDNKTITFNGTHTYTNVSGGSLITLTSSSATPITHTITSSNMSITFDNGTTRTWSVARQRVFSYSSGIVITQTGTYSDGTLQGVSEWGTDRFGNSFTAQITSPLIVSQSCDFQLTSGTHVLTNTAGVLTLTYGLTSTGAVSTACPALGSVYYFQLVWAGTGGKTYTFILPY
jgi:hypothetical protein